MAGNGRLKRLAALAAVLAAIGCKDSGLRDRNLPLEEARHREWSYPLYQMASGPRAQPQLISLGETTWARQAWPTYYNLGAANIPQQLLRAGGSGAAGISTLTWDEAPFDRLYIGAGTRTQTYERVY